MVVANQSDCLGETTLIVSSEIVQNRVFSTAVPEQLNTHTTDRQTGRQTDRQTETDLSQPLQG
eukprot:12148264-Alexandrium_andersonii.AAC.1